MHESGQIGQLPGGGGGLPKIFFRPFGPHSGLKIGGAGTPGPSRGSGTGYGTLK